MLKHTAFSLFLFMGSHLLNAAGLADRVLILVNDATPPENGTNGLGASVFVGQYYANARGIPTANILHLNTAISEGMEYPVYVNQVESPVRAYLSANNNKMQGQILYIVPAYGVPVSFRYAGGSLAVDSVMAAMLTNPTLGNAAYNPYSLPIGTRPARFDMWSDARPVGNKIFIVSRLDGPNAIIAKGLVDKAIGAETSLTRQSGTGYFDVQGTRVPSEWQYAVDLEMQYASAASAAAGFPTVVNLQRDTGAMIHQAAVNMYDASTRTMGIYPPGTTATLSAPVSAFTEGTATVTFTGIAATTSANTLTFILTTANPSTYVKLLYPLPPFMGYDQTTYMTIQKVVGGATVASNSLLIQSGDAALAALKTLRFDIRNTGIAVVRDNATLIALTDPAAAAMNYTGLTISDKGAYIGVNGLTVTDFAGAVLWNDDFSADSRARYQWSLPGLQGANALWAWGWYGGATDAYRFVNGAIGAQLTSYTANTIRTPVNPDPAVAGIGAQRWGGAWVPMMLEEGITGTWGAVDEPYVNYYARAGNVLDHFWAGYNFGESFFIAQQALAWRVVAVGDPLYAPVIFRTGTLPVNVSVAPGPVATTGGGQPVQMTATVTGGSGNTSVTWSVNPQVGAMSASGMYTPPAAILTQQTVTITATSTEDPARNGSTTMVLPAIVMALGPLNPSAAAGKTVQFSAQVVFNQNTAVTWSISPLLGTISATGLYTAPPAIAAAQTVTVTATSLADPTKSIASTMTLLGPLTVKVTAASATLVTGQAQPCTATVTGSVNAQVTWSISPATGSISTSGVYTAPLTVVGIAIVTVKATSAADPLKSGSITFYVLPAVMVSPGTATLNGGQSQAFAAIVMLVPGPSSINWSISPQVGAISAAGVYTAPAEVTAKQTVTLTATSAADSTKSASIKVTLLAPVVVTVAAPGDTVAAGAKMQFTYTIAGGGVNTTVTWSVTAGPGSISSSGLYTAPASVTDPKAVTVKATSTADTSKSATATVTLVP